MNLLIDMQKEQQIKKKNRNPFFGKTKLDIQLKNKAKMRAYAGTHIDKETGEELGENTFIQVNAPMETKSFIKAYSEGIKQICGLPLPATRVLSVLLESYREGISQDKIFVSFRVAQADR